MITTTTELCNLALSKLGARRIASFEDNTTTEAKACRLHLFQVRDSLLRRHQWDFATTSKALSRIGEDPLSEYESAWQMPVDCVRIIRLSSGDSNLPLMDFARRGRRILINGEDTLELVYVSNEVPVNEWDSLFVDALVLSLAGAIASDVTQNTGKAAECKQELEALALPTAQTADAREANSGENFGVSKLIAQSALANCVRRSGGYNRTVVLP